MSEFGKRGIRVVAVSVDPVEVRRMFGEKAGLTFPLLSDPEEKVIRPYDVLHIRGGPKGVNIARPAEFLIDPTSAVRQVNLTDDVTVRASGDEVLREADRLGFGARPQSFRQLTDSPAQYSLHPLASDTSFEGGAMQSPLTIEHVQQLKTFDTCVIADAIESFGVRLRNEGFATAGFRCLFKSLPPMVGYAATCKVRSAGPPIVGSQYVERTDWWKHICEIPAPRVLVLQDLDDPPGTGAYLGKVHANILMALGCVGAITNGAARELSGIEESCFHIFAGRLALSRAYVHVIEYGRPVEVGGLTIQPGDLLHGDRHGVLIVPQQLAMKLPAVAHVIREKKQQLIDLSRKPGTTHEEISRGLKDLHDFNPDSIRAGANQWK